MQEQGLALLGLTARPDGALYSDRVIRLSAAGRAQRLPAHLFSRGDTVLLSTGDPTQDATSAVVVQLAASWIRVSIGAAAAHQFAGRGFRVDLAANTVAFERTQRALDSFQVVPAVGDASGALTRCGLLLSCLLHHLERV